MLISKSQKPGYNLYTLACGHVVEIFSGNYNKGQYRCPECFIDKQRQIADEAGLHLVEYRKKPEKSLFTFKSCGHSKEISNSQVASKQVSCGECHVIRLKDILHRCNFSFVVKTGNVVTVKCKTCQQQGKRKIPTLMCKGKIRCEHCYKQSCQLSMLEKTIENNLAFVKRTSDKDYGIFKLPCGCLKAMQYHSAMNNSWRCNECEVSCFTEKSSLYLVELNFEDFVFIKFGFSKNISRRFSEYSSKPFLHTIHRVVELRSGLDAMLIEKQIHNKYRESKISLDISSKYLDKSGATECYYKEMLPTLIKEMEGLLE